MSFAAQQERLWRGIGAIRSGDFDLSTEAGRSLHRYRRAAQATGVSVGARFLNIVALFVAIRIVSNHATPDGFGLWLLLVTAVALVGFADLGIGNGLLNIVANADGRDDHDSTRQAVSSAFLALTGLAVGLGAAFALIYPHVNWASVFNVSGPTAAEAGPAVVAFMLCVLVSLPLSLAQRINHAHQLGWIANIWVALGSVLSLVGVMVAASAGAGVAVLVGVFLAGPPIAYLIDSIILYFWSRPDIRPRLRNATLEAAQMVLGRGLLFFVLATVAAVSYEADTLIISHYLGADQVQNYAVPFRLFVLAPSAAIILLAPLWPAYGEAVARDDLPWVHRTLRRSVGLGFAVTAVPSLILIPLAPAIIRLWVGDSVTTTLPVLIGIAVWAVFNGVSTALGMFSNGAGTLKIQVVVAVAMGCSNVALSIVFVRWFGISGPIWGTVLTQLLFGFIPAWFMMHRLFTRECRPEDFRRYLDRWSDLKPSERAVPVE